MDFTYLYVRYLGPRTCWSKVPWLNRDHFVMLLGEALLRPSGNPTTDEKKTCNADSNARHKACKEERDAEGEKYRPRRACWHLYGVSLTLFRAAVVHHESPSNQINDCKHHDPYRIHEMPIKGDHTEAFALPRVDPTEQRKDKDRGKKKHTDHDMGCV